MIGVTPNPRGTKRKWAMNEIRTLRGDGTRKTNFFVVEVIYVMV